MTEKLICSFGLYKTQKSLESTQSFQNIETWEEINQSQIFHLVS